MANPPIMLPPEPFLLVDDLTHLRGLRIEEAETLFCLVDANRLFLRRWLPWVDGTQCIADSERFIQSARDQLDANHSLTTGIWFNTRLAGVVGFHRIDWANHSVEIGYWLGEGFQGRGIMTSAVRTLTDYAFEDLRLHRVVIRCATGNFKSQAIPERLGFTKEGKVRDAEYLNGAYVDLFIYGMLEQDWRAGRD